MTKRSLLLLYLTVAFMITSLACVYNGQKNPAGMTAGLTLFPTGAFHGECAVAVAVTMVALLFMCVYTRRHLASEKLLLVRNRELANVKNELQAILDAVPALVIQKNLRNEYVRLNRQAREFLKLPPHQKEFIPNCDLFPEEMARKHWQEDQEVVTSGKGKYNIVERVVTPNGERVWSYSKIPLRGGAGDIEGVVAFAQDVTDRIRAEEQARRDSEIMSTAQRIAHLGNWYWDIPRNLVHLSEEASRLFGFESYRLVTYDTIIDLVHPEDRPAFVKAVEKSLRKKQPYSVEYRLIAADGQVNYIHGQGEVTFDAHGNPESMCGTVLNITERKNAEAALLSYQEQLRNLTEGISLAEERERRRIAGQLHDQVGQSLMFSKIKLNALAKSPLSPEQAKLLQETVSSIDEIITEVRTLTSQIHSPLLYQVGLAAAIEQLCEQLGEQHGVTFTFRGQEEVQHLDEERKVALYQIVREALVNAIKHSAARTVIVSLAIGTSTLRISVSDDGVGFDTSIVTRPRTSGGFGLFNISQRTEHLGGEFRIRSEAGNGTEVVITVPLLHQ